MYTLYDTITKITAGTYKNRTTANKAADRKNSAYGCYRYIVQLIEK